MYKGDFAGTLKLAEQLERNLSVLKAQADLLVPPALRTQLFEFSAAAEDHPVYDRAGGLARSLAVLLENDQFAHPDEPGGQQLRVIINSLIGMLRGSTRKPNDPSRPPLVTPISPSLVRSNNRVALYIDNAAVQTLLYEPLIQAGFVPVDLNSLADLLDETQADVPVAIVADLDLCQLDPDFSKIFATLRERCDPPPHLICLANPGDVPARLEAVRLGATRCFSKPLDISRMISMLKGVTAQTQTRAFKVMVVDDDRVLGQLYREVLSDAGMEPLVIDNPLRAPDLIRRFEPDVILSDVYMPGCNGLELAAVLRQDDALADTPIILLSSDDDGDCQLEALDLGADDFLIKPVNISVLIATVRARAKRARALKRSRSEYRRVLERMRQMEKELPGSQSNSIEVETLLQNHVDIDDYEVSESVVSEQVDRRPQV